jgi:hypothetical protein
MLRSGDATIWGFLPASLGFRDFGAPSAVSVLTFVTPIFRFFGTSESPDTDATSVPRTTATQEFGVSRRK